MGEYNFAHDWISVPEPAAKVAPQEIKQPQKCSLCKQGSGHNASNCHVFPTGNKKRKIKLSFDDEDTYTNTKKPKHVVNHV